MKMEDTISLDSLSVEELKNIIGGFDDDVCPVCGAGADCFVDGVCTICGYDSKFDSAACRNGCRQNCITGQVQK
jgi:hypothetical protein